MLFKPRYEPVELKLLRFLNTRIKLSPKVVGYLLNLEKGFEGELVFDKCIENLSDNWLIMNDLLLETNNTIYQLDSILISPDTIHLFEVKNFEGDYYFEDDKWYTISGKEIKNPLLQLKRAESLFRRLLQDLRFSFSIEANVIFVNPNFFLYQAPINLPIIFPNQIEGFMKKLNMRPPTQTNTTTKFVEKLSTILLEESPYKNLPEYSYEQLKKGITCSKCNRFMTRFNKNNIVCQKCETIEENGHALLRSVEEYKFLFPSRKITTNVIYDWCKIIHSKKVVRRILNENFSLTGRARSAHFVEHQPVNE
ncbi:nuclease-related domain-containing protein [Bacillus sp. FJAT-49736]|uniref:nuclease-related domain-containing protein n=1 Tax=Bacillus sp. FJAT-49736 TaxID=2833582 RepID=UPI001BC932AE|nr:nuclease-related domain-containing protein [Bacillus sp. FJAT-49736]MBS4174442.1 NERD domain-containing protein [Bacillus sp. FJAT-49736]MBS4175799.1 NERD domain-containing protein [Bacillus sp. FJAT-49736]